ncbi:hypothetical protein ACJMK2_037754 [Sinanodonta woodiana]|uniref:Uncharacterized protein n=1 Tax=Sinanodonta woodiana TaxID=1069815 RepID=A0ABD3WMS8_SINWO
MVQIGDKNLSTYNFPAERQKTLDDSSSTHSSVSSLADSPHLPSSSLGELPVSRNLSSLLNLTEDIEQDTQPNQISNGRDSSEIHADTEQTYRKVV